MKIEISSPDTLLFAKSDMPAGASRGQQVAVSVLALFALGTQIGVFVLLNSLLGAS